jgi:hypothetical protein
VHQENMGSRSAEMPHVYGGDEDNQLYLQEACDQENPCFLGEQGILVWLGLMILCAIFNPGWNKERIEVVFS